ncbi:hypothetical protein LCGC14_1773220 [marine sediment metagenome]|uniref:Uncharacterized protein n=1 Tax=marine sediment metagenome TaxID=412755 RepID=A0A0F9HK36_9ZZZZ
MKCVREGCDNERDKSQFCADHDPHTGAHCIHERKTVRDNVSTCDDCGGAYEAICICDETVVGKDYCPVHGYHPAVIEEGLKKLLQVLVVEASEIPGDAGAPGRKRARQLYIAIRALMEYMVRDATMTSEAGTAISGVVELEMPK